MVLLFPSVFDRNMDAERCPRPVSLRMGVLCDDLQCPDLAESASRETFATTKPVGAAARINSHNPMRT